MDINHFLLFAALFYAVPFGIALAMPDWRSLSTLAVILGVALIGLFVSVESGGGNGLAVGLGFGFIFCGGGGLLSGAITRALFLLLAQSKINAIVLVAIGIVGFTLLPVLVSALNKWQQWQNRPPSESCLANKHSVTIGGAVYYLPSAPNIAVWTKTNSIYSFKFNKGVRTICEQSDNSSEPIHVINLSIEMVGGYSRHPYCRTPKNGWELYFCSPNFNSTDINYPRQVNIYSPTEFNHKRMLANYSYANFVEELEKAKANKHPLASRQVGIFEHYDNRYWIVRDGSWKNDAGEPFILNCHDSTPTGTLGCSTTYLLKTGSQVTYRFYASLDNLETIAKQVDENVHLMIVELATP